VFVGGHYNVGGYYANVFSSDVKLSLRVETQTTRKGGSGAILYFGRQYISLSCTFDFTTERKVSIHKQLLLLSA